MTTRPALDRFYPIVPNVEWLERIVPLGVKTIQLRVKNVDAPEARRQISAGLTVTRLNGCQLIVNDYWREAIDLGAAFVHLGQEDLAGADLPAIRRAGLRIGVSTHDDAELDVALAAEADYVALGPIYETTLKAMKFGPQGLDRVRDWKRRVGDLPLVAIGGVTIERATAVIEAGAQSVAVITDFMSHPEPLERVRLWIEWARQPVAA